MSALYKIKRFCFRVLGVLFFLFPAIEGVEDLQAVDLLVRVMCRNRPGVGWNQSAVASSC